MCTNIHLTESLYSKFFASLIILLAVRVGKINMGSSSRQGCNSSSGFELFKYCPNGRYGHFQKTTHVINTDT